MKKTSVVMKKLELTLNRVSRFSFTVSEMFKLKQAMCMTRVVACGCKKGIN